MNIPEGWKLVPIEPTEEMIVAGTLEIPKIIWSENALKVAESVFRAMLAAAPTPPAQEESLYIKIFANAKGSPAGYDTNIEHDDVFERLVTYFHAEVTLGREDEPVAWMYESQRHRCVSMCRDDNKGGDEIETPLYLHPANDKLRKVAEGVLEHWATLSADYRLIKSGMDNLRAALEGK